MKKKIPVRGAVSILLFLWATPPVPALSLEVKISDKPLAPPTGGKYAGSSFCKDCHPDQYRKWFLSSHALAYQSLKKSKKADSRCLRCHTTGFGVQSGFQDNSALAGVQCEACHGPSSRHAASAGNSSPVSTPGLQPDCDNCGIGKICMPCHTAHESPDFDFNLYYGRIRHK